MTLTFHGQSRNKRSPIASNLIGTAWVPNKPYEPVDLIAYRQTSTFDYKINEIDMSNMGQIQAARRNCPATRAPIFVIYQPRHPLCVCFVALVSIPIRTELQVYYLQPIEQSIDLFATTGPIMGRFIE